MPLKRYGVLKGRPIARRLAIPTSNHFHIHVIDGEADYRVAVNVSSGLPPADLEYYLDADFEHPITERLPHLPVGFKLLDPRPQSLAIDIIRGNFLDQKQLTCIPYSLPGPDNDLNEKIDCYVQQAMSDETAMLYAFGELWGPEVGLRDPIFGFEPRSGMHNVHMNQGNAPGHQEDDGVWQDGALMLHFPKLGQWVAIFFKFQAQSLHTSDRTGHYLKPKPILKSKATGIDELKPEDRPIRIVGALVNPVGIDRGSETVTLLNVSPETIDLTGWAIANQFKEKHALQGKLSPGEAIVIHLPVDVRLDNDGGIITLLDSHGTKVHGVVYSRKQALREGWTIKF
jgi:uncharacterized protein YukJ